MRAKRYVIGLTGPTSAGKDAVAAVLGKTLKAHIINADQIGHAIYKKGRPAYAKTVKTFGKEILDSDGQINRPKLAAIVFNSPKALKKLNVITHPAIRREIQRQIQTAKSKYIIINAALWDELSAGKL